MFTHLMESYWTDPVRFDPERFARVAAYEERFGEGLSYQAAGASQAGLLLQLAIEKAGSLETDKVREALRSYNGTTFWGPTRWDETGQNMAGQTVTFQIQGGEIVTVYPSAAAQAKPVYPMP